MVLMISYLNHPHPHHNDCIYLLTAMDLLGFNNVFQFFMSALCHSLLVLQTHLSSFEWM
jgi:hypothetical protein